MKRVILTFCLAAVVAAGANAQLYVGGQLGFQTGKTIYPGIYPDTIKSTTFIFGPEVGYSLNDKWDVGANLDLSISTNRHNQQKNSYFGWSVAPYARYTFAQFGDFKVLAKGSLFINGTSETTKNLLLPNADHVINTSFEVGATIYPMLAYSISEHVCLLTELNFLGVNFTTGNTKTKLGANTTTTSKYTSFGLNANTGNAFNLGALTVGFAYVF